MPLTQFLQKVQPYPEILKDVLQPKEMSPPSTVNLFKTSEMIPDFKTWHVGVALSWVPQVLEKMETSRRTQAG